MVATYRSRIPESFLRPPYMISKRHTNIQSIRARVITACFQLLAEVGPRAFTVKEAARRAGVGRTTVYKYFGIKAELLGTCREDLAMGKHSRNLKWSAGAVRNEMRAHPRKRSNGLPRTLESTRHALLLLEQHLRLESDLFLLATAEGLRSKRRPRQGFHPVTLVPRQFLRTVRQTLLEAKQAGHLKPCLSVLEAEEYVTALWWTELCLGGPRSDGAVKDPSVFAARVERLLAGLAAN